MAIHLWWNFDLNKIKRKMGFKEQPEYIPVPQVAADEDDEEDRPLVSPPSIVYGSNVTTGAQTSNLSTLK